MAASSPHLLSNPSSPDGAIPLPLRPLSVPVFRCPSVIGPLPFPLPDPTSDPTSDLHPNQGTSTTTASNTGTSTGTDTPRVRPRVEVISSARGRVYYFPRDPFDWKLLAAEPPTFPSPRIRPRQRRPHSIHTVSYPPGFIPSDLSQPSPPRPPPLPRRQKKEKSQPSRKSLSLERFTLGIRVIDTFLAALSSPPKSPLGSGSSSYRSSSDSTLGASSTQPLADSVPTPRSEPRTSSPSLASSIVRRLSRTESSRPRATPAPQAAATNPNETAAMRVPTMVDVIRPPSMGPHAHSHHRNSIMSMRSAKSIATSSVAELQEPVASGSGVACSISLAEPNVFLTGFDHDGHHRPEGQNATSLLRGTLQLSVSKNVKIKAITLKLVGKARTEWPEGIPPLKVDQYEEETLRAQCLVFFHAMHMGIGETEYGNQCTYQLKGSGSTSRPGTASRRVGLSPDQESVISLPGIRNRQGNSNHGLSSRELKRLSLQSVKSRSFGKGDNPAANPVQAKGYKVFFPGTYQYSFELPIDHHQLETTKLQYGSVKWELEATVERAGAFKPNLRGTKEVSIVRVPDQLSLEMTEPISISRRWEDQMHYDIVISGKSFPIGGKIPIAFKLTPLAKVQLHKLKVFVTESVEYRTNDRRVTRKDPGRKILLLEKAAGKPLDPQYRQSEFRVLGGGELTPTEREAARSAAARRRAMDAARAHRLPEPLPEPADNILGDLDLGLESYWCSTEIEMNVQMPTCEVMAKDKTMRLHPDCSWKNANVYHWIKVVLRISRADPEDPTGRRRRHFEISIDSPITVLNCRATQANTALPRYQPDRDSGSLPTTPLSQQPPSRQHPSSCGCPDAIPIAPSPASSTASLGFRVAEAESEAIETADVILADGGNSSGSGTNRTRGRTMTGPTALPAPPRAVHLQQGGSSSPGCPTAQSSSLPRPPTWPLRHSAITNSASAASSNGNHPDWAEPEVSYRPMELLRYPSYNPPAFDADEPPPAIAMTPPPNYDLIVGTPSVDGLADYFSRLADYEEDVEGAHHRQEEQQQQDNAVPPTDPSSATTPVAQAEGAADYLTTPADVHAEEGSDDDSSDSGDEHHPARIHRGGRVNVANPRTPGGRLVPSRSLDLERPVMMLSMAGVVRRGE